MVKINFNKLACVILTACLLPAQLQAQTPEEKGLQIAKDLKESDIGWGDSQSDMKMTLRNKKGDESARKTRNKDLEIDGDGDKSLTIFDYPRDVKGTAFLSFSHTVTPDDQWMYMPALKRVKRIASKNKSGPFMGSEFAYEDLSSFEVEKYSYKYLRDDELNGASVYVLESYPAYPHSGYTRLVSYIHKTHYRTEKIEFYDRKDSLLKTLDYLEYRQYLDKYWRASRMEMLNHQTGKSTSLIMSNYRFRTGLDEGDFNQSSLKRAK